MADYVGVWQEKHSGTLIVLSLAPFGWNDLAYFTREEASSAASKKFTKKEDLQFPGEEGHKEAIKHYLNLRDQLNETAIELVPDTSLVLSPSDLVRHRQKTKEEAIMDEAMLYIEMAEYDHVQTLLGRLQTERNSLFALSIARRAAQNHAADLPDSAHAEKYRSMKMAATHAQKIIDCMHGKDLYQVACYGFGRDYQSANRMVAYAASTLGDYLLNYENAPEQALQVLEIGDATNYGGRWLAELQVCTLLQLNRTADAFSLHKQYQLNMESVTSRAEYQTYLADEFNKKASQEAARIAAIRTHVVDGEPITDSDLNQLAKKFGPLPPSYIEWIKENNLSELHVEDGDSREEYRVFSPQQAIEKHDELMGWLHLHDESDPEITEEIFEMIRESDIDPAKMLPIVGNDHTPDCFLIRLDGQEAGKVYFWGHDERAIFADITDSAAELFVYLEARAQEGQTFVL